MRRFATVGAAVACSRFRGGPVDRWTGWTTAPAAPIGESPTKKQATHHESHLVPGRMAPPANGSFDPGSSRTMRVLHQTVSSSPDRRMIL
jgi:hypothetical protein